MFFTVSYLYSNHINFIMKSNFNLFIIGLFCYMIKTLSFQIQDISQLYDMSQFPNNAIYIQ